MTDLNAYQQLEQRFRRRADIDHALAIIGWDEAAMMPAGGGEARARSMASLEVMSHDLLVSSEVGDLFAAAASVELDPWQQANLAAMQREYVQATAVPTDLVEALNLACSRCEQAWRVHRAANDWAALVPLQEEVVALSQQKAQAVAAVTGLGHYDALLDDYEPGMRGERIEQLFGQLKTFLPDLVNDVIERQSVAGVTLIDAEFPVADQARVGRAMMAALGFDFEHGRLDISHHPFCGGVPDDVRITTRYGEGGFLSTLMATIHETGHALYEQGLPRDWRGQPVGEALSTATHESQSLIMEMQACRTPEFAGFVAPILARELGVGEVDPAVWQPDNVWRLLTRVEKGFIRVDADEVTYPLHVMLRFELERDLIEGRLAVADLPERWREGMLEYLGLDTAGRDDNGCMQDVHWPAGLFGYFPTYTLGAMTAAQLFQAACAQNTELLPGLADGNFAPLRDWLRREVHSQGQRRSYDDMLRSASGRTLDVAVFEQHLKQRYLG